MAGKQLMSILKRHRRKTKHCLSTQELPVATLFTHRGSGFFSTCLTSEDPGNELNLAGVEGTRDAVLVSFPVSALCNCC